jgi:hypothetical protein
VKFIIAFIGLALFYIAGIYLIKGFIFLVMTYPTPSLIVIMGSLISLLAGLIASLWHYS